MNGQLKTFWIAAQNHAAMTNEEIDVAFLLPITNYRGTTHEP